MDHFDFQENNVAMHLVLINFQSDLIAKSLSSNSESTWRHVPKEKYRILAQVCLKRCKSNAAKQSEGEILLPDHIQQTVKQPSEEMVWCIFITDAIENLVHIKVMINYVKYIEILRSRIVQIMITFDGTFPQD
ncbi:hypothetical protein TNCV_4625541 [Trichonephila clavipes]|nr:hypothetical protein TNCV_4625541 [Trichonephila clavipes]